MSEDIPGAIPMVPEMERCPLLPLIVIGAVLEEPLDHPPCRPEPDRLGREAARCIVMLAGQLQDQGSVV